MPESLATPPHHPTFNVRLSAAHVEVIVSKVFPKHHLAKSKQLESGKSYNNRIYFIDVVPNTDGQAAAEQYVLKVGGNNFGATKIQNEVACLQLLAKYCPRIPVPRLVAWSDNGKIITTVDGRSAEISMDSGKDECEQNSSTLENSHGWVLTTRLPGRLLDFSDLDGVYGPEIMKKLASYMAEWRSNMPNVSQYGSLRYQESSDSSRSNTTFGNLGGNLPIIVIGGFLWCTTLSTESYQSAAQFYESLADDQLRKLKASKLLAPLADRIETETRHFIFNQLHQLPLFQNRNEAAKFTHLDFAPRNILVSIEEPHKITGILDWEFASFLPWEEEFLNMQIRQSNDWPKHHYYTLVRELGKLGEKVPPLARNPPASMEAEPNAYTEACVLAKVIEKIAPWYIQEGLMSQAQLQAEIDKASHSVLNGIKQLQGFLKRS